MTQNDQAYFVCPRNERDRVSTTSKVEAWQKLRCGDCAVAKECDGPVLKEATEEVSPSAPARRGRPPKVPAPEAVPEESSTVDPEPNNEAACRAALLSLFSANKNNKLLQKRAEEIVGKFQEEIATARSQGVGWKPIAKTLKEHGFTLGWNAAQKAFARVSQQK